MHVNDARRTGALMQIVDILRHESQCAAALREAGFEPRQRGMGGVGRSGEQIAPTRIVKRMHQRRIAGEGLGRRELHRIVALPQRRARPAKDAEAAFGGDARAGEDEEVHLNARCLTPSCPRLSRASTPGHCERPKHHRWIMQHSDSDYAVLPSARMAGTRPAMTVATDERLRHRVISVPAP